MFEQTNERQCTVRYVTSTYRYSSIAPCFFFNRKCTGIVSIHLCVFLSRKFKCTRNFIVALSVQYGSTPEQYLHNNILTFFLKQEQYGTVPYIILSLFYLSHSNFCYTSTYKEITLKFGKYFKFQQIPIMNFAWSKKFLLCNIHHLGKIFVCVYYNCQINFAKHFVVQ